MKLRETEEMIRENTKEMSREREERNQRNKKRWHDIRNALLMLCVTVAMLSTTTYAWFTLTDQPMVKGLRMTASATGGLKICETADGTYGQQVEITENYEDHTLSPVTVTDATPTFESPVYTQNVVTATEAIADDKLEEYVAHYEYYLKTDSTTAVNVGLIAQNGTDASTATGSFVMQGTGTTATMKAANAIRVGFKIGDVWKIFEPNKDLINDSENKAGNNVTAPTSNVVQTGNTNGVGTITYTGDQYLFSLNPSTAQKVDMYIWIEGTDDSCVDEIQKDLIDAQIQFTVLQ